MQSAVLSSHIQVPGLRRGLYGSLLLHLLLFFSIVFLQELSPPPVVFLGTGPGGGQGGETLRVNLTGALDGGTGELFKPSLRPQPPATTMPEPAKQKVVEAAPQKDEFQVPARKIKERAKSKQPTQPAPPESSDNEKVPTLTPELLAKVRRGITGGTDQPANQIPRETGPGAGGSGRSAGSGGGYGGGEGVRIGQGSGNDPLMDSWYARQVEKRIGENWLRTNFESLAGRRLATVIRFDILPNGRIDNIVREQSSGVSFYDLAAERAIRSSNPLPRPPAEFQNRTVRFICYFEYPPEKGR
ncbi:MAG TPA: TonB family protein [Acidobacteriota bacterium]|nr:TonB family protein [Acidobacteriota bacterium]